MGFIYLLRIFIGNIYLMGFIFMIIYWKKDKEMRDEYLVITLISFVVTFTLSGGGWLVNLFMSLFIVGIVGIFYYWKKSQKKRHMAIALVIVSLFIGVIVLPNDDDQIYVSSNDIQEAIENNKVKAEEIEEELKEAKALAEKEKAEAEEKAEKEAKEKEEMEQTEKAKSEMIDVNYIRMFNDYSDDIYKGKYIRTAGRIERKSEDIVISDGLDGLVAQIVFSFEDDEMSQLDSVNEGDYVILTGQVEVKMIGTMFIENSNIESVGGGAEKLALSYASNYDAEVAENERVNMQEFKSKTEVVDYNDVVRNPHKYKGKSVRVTLKIAQTMEGGILTDSGYAGNESGTDNEWYVSYKLPENTSRIIEGDTVTFYGEFDDVRKMKRAFTRQEVYMPRLKALYYE